jgi:hypothetical protein
MGEMYLTNIENRQHQDIQIFETILTSLLVSIKTSSMIAQLYLAYVWFMVFNATFTNISVISWR